ncbi:hypothetical protein RJ639_037064 [Escallonia herrerae]|uniref:FAD-binding domain-containing protein n=1 Tax=Escallonia herrerae TaxID=1293975 RepID=A0AA88WPZ8_9ASTE|nr:hypothetical protein RJ639_037064 [Escallonia herrerae]
MSIASNLIISPTNVSKLLFPQSKPSVIRPKRLTIQCAKRSKRTGKLRYPSEKKKLKSNPHAQIGVENKFIGFWRLSKLGVSVHNDPGKDFLDISAALLQEIAKVLKFPVASMLPPEAFTVIRKSLDARKSQKEPKFMYTVEIDVNKLLSLEPHTWDFISRLEPRIGLIEHVLHERVSGDLIRMAQDIKKINGTTVTGKGGHSSYEGSTNSYPATKKPRIAVVGSGPAGLFSALVLAELGADVTIIERGEAVEQRGRDIGALVVRRILQPESNFCFGEVIFLSTRLKGLSKQSLLPRKARRKLFLLLPIRGAFSVCKTRCENQCAGFQYLGAPVLHVVENLEESKVMETLVRFGAPKSILVDGKPHLGTDRLIPLLQNFRRHLQELGVTFRFGTRVDDLLIEDAFVVGVKVSSSREIAQSNSQKLRYDAVVLAVGHSARDVYQMLLSHNVDLVRKDFAVGLRIEHPQELINSIQSFILGDELLASAMLRSTDTDHVEMICQMLELRHVYSGLADEVRRGHGKLPVADYKVVEYVSKDDVDGSSSSGPTGRSCYSFCMCPGGQVVLTSTNPAELCVNGMSFSRRASKWANAALVVSVSSNDFDALNLHGPLAGVELQREFERRAAIMGGGNFVVPVQTVTDFLENKLSEANVPPSSYRLGVKAANLHDLFPVHITEALQYSISMFEKETRTSSPLQIPRSGETYESTSLKGLYPVGEGAGYAGGIVSAAVDGMHAGFALAKNLSLHPGDIEMILGRAQNAISAKY